MLQDKTVRDFIAELGSDSPAPGGGSTAALAGALGAALIAMVCRLTVSNAKYAAVQPEMGDILAKYNRLTLLLAECIDKDTEAFNQVMAAYKMPKGSETEKSLRSQAIQESMKQAALLPLEVAEYCLKILETAIRVLAIGNPNAASDAAVAGSMAYAGLNGALYNVKININAIKDERFVAELTEKIAGLKNKAREAYRELEKTADQHIG